MHLVKLGTWILLAGLCMSGPVAIYAQAPPGPLPAGQPRDVPASAAKPRNLPPEPPPRTTILGAWKLNRDESDDPRKRREDDRDS